MIEINLKKDRMTKDERLEALLNRRPMDRIPVWLHAFGFAPVNAGLSIVDFYNDPQKSYDSQISLADKFSFQQIPHSAYAAFGGWEFGGEIKWPSGEFSQAPTVLKHPVETEDDIWKLKVPEVRTAGIVPLLMEISKLVDKSGSNYIVGFIVGPFTTAANITGVDKFTKWMIKKPDVIHHLLRLVTDFTINLSQYWADTFGPERIIIWSGEPTASNQVISPKQFGQFAFPYIKDFQEKSLSMGIKHIQQHICGEQNENLTFWSQIPYGDPGIVSFGHEVDLGVASKHFPNEIIMGNIEPAIVQAGTQEEVYQKTKVCIEKGKKHPGGFLLSTGCELPPMAPEDNIWAIMQAVSDFGWYY